MSIYPVCQESDPEYLGIKWIMHDRLHKIIRYGTHPFLVYHIVYYFVLYITFWPIMTVMTYYLDELWFSLWLLAVKKKTYNSPELDLSTDGSLHDAMMLDLPDTSKI